MTRTGSPFSLRNALRLFAVAMLASVLSGCGYNQFQTKDEATKAAWGEVVNQYQRRADLIPNLVNTVKGYATHERETLEAVTRARAAATSFQASATRMLYCSICSGAVVFTSSTAIWLPVLAS